ncbi:Phosphoribosyltransferase [Nostoc sp. NIES-3756]|jgi:hypoxanthine phosphoribosyltransferase|uniref:phosphoribosyltransferase n=1 Tax=Nostoc sp. NIES-3756 TaxID=1751286 RepID=UPI0007208177|nr:phosphoribosyltransferase [Nostoc sp. NIES-3756]BAT52542.1 Phosphoribosyltransferase [Nostoc sp. NIES-3756]BAY39769.1 phosphoribosyltransferase [Nostoc sp. NIES-2111]
MPDLYVSWSEYHYKIEQLAAQIYESSWEFDQIVCLARGGLRVGDILSRIYHKPLAILATSSYSGVGQQARGSLILSRHLTMTTESLGSRILLVDDLVDSGITLQETIPWLHEYSDFIIKEIRTSVVWYKACSIFKPDYYVDYLPDNPWIHQPFEHYEHTNPADLVAKVGQSCLWGR